MNNDQHFNMLQVFIMKEYKCKEHNKSFNCFHTKKKCFLCPKCIKYSYSIDDSNLFYYEDKQTILSFIPKIFRRNLCLKHNRQPYKYYCTYHFKYYCDACSNHRNCFDNIKLKLLKDNNKLNHSSRSDNNLDNCNRDNLSFTSYNNVSNLTHRNNKAINLSKIESDFVSEISESEKIKSNNSFINNNVLNINKKIKKNYEEVLLDKTDNNILNEIDNDNYSDNFAKSNKIKNLSNEENSNLTNNDISIDEKQNLNFLTYHFLVGKRLIIFLFDIQITVKCVLFEKMERALDNNFLINYICRKSGKSNSNYYFKNNNIFNYEYSIDICSKQLKSIQHYLIFMFNQESSCSKIIGITKQNILIGFDNFNKLFTLNLITKQYNLYEQQEISLKDILITNSNATIQIVKKDIIQIYYLDKLETGKICLLVIEMNEQSQLLRSKILEMEERDSEFLDKIKIKKIENFTVNIFFRYIEETEDMFLYFILDDQLIKFQLFYDLNLSHFNYFSLDVHRNLKENMNLERAFNCSNYIDKFNNLYYLNIEYVLIKFDSEDKFKEVFEFI